MRPRRDQLLAIDPSEYRPDVDHPVVNEKTQKLRNFQECVDHVKMTYYRMHTNQTREFALQKKEKWGQLNHAEMTIMEAVEHLNGFVDESDPDVDFPNSLHAYQTAERIREVHPEKEWFQLTGFIHDLGKVMALWGEPQWCVVGDTFATGCAPVESIVFGRESFEDNPDLKNPKFNTKLGIYKEHCGLDNVVLSWGHDEYLYQVMKANQCTLPEEALYVIRYHSFYPWHTGKDYDFLCNDKDREMKKWVEEFNKFDLYSKSDKLPDCDELYSYYERLAEKYCPGKLKW